MSDEAPTINRTFSAALATLRAEGVRVGRVRVDVGATSWQRLADMLGVNGGSSRIVHDVPGGCQIEFNLAGSAEPAPEPEAAPEGEEQPKRRGRPKKKADE